MVREDPSLVVEVDGESGQTVLKGIGELHLEVRRVIRVCPKCRGLVSEELAFWGDPFALFVRRTTMSLRVAASNVVL